MCEEFFGLSERKNIKEIKNKIKNIDDKWEYGKKTEQDWKITPLDLKFTFKLFPASLVHSYLLRDVFVDVYFNKRNIRIAKKILGNYSM